jgi:hypothetical protein
MLELDHVLIAVADLAEGAAELERRTGLASVAGGRHPAWGTANRIVPLGGTYLELIAVVEPEIAATTNVGRWVTRTPPGRPMGWVLRTDDIDPICERLGLVAVAGSRLTPDGLTLTWRTAGIDEASAEPSLPFFIEWGPGTVPPGAAVAGHAMANPRIERIVLTSPDPRRVRDRIRAATPPIEIRPGSPAVASVVIAHDGGEFAV